MTEDEEKAKNIRAAAANLNELISDAARIGLLVHCELKPAKYEDPQRIIVTVSQEL